MSPGSLIPRLIGRLYSVDWTRDWTVGLDSELSSFRVTETTQEIYSFQLTEDVSF